MVGIELLSGIAAVVQNPVADGGALFVGGGEGCLVDAGPQGFALGAQRLDGVPGLRRGRLRSGRSSNARARGSWVPALRCAPAGMAKGASAYAGASQPTAPWLPAPLLLGSPPLVAALVEDLEAFLLAGVSVHDIGERISEWRTRVPCVRPIHRGAVEAQT